jgi:FkbM family methyltransferase
MNMNRISKIFSRKVIYYIALKMQLTLMRYTERMEKNEREFQEIKWRNLFNNKESFIFELKNGVRIQLYVDSLLSKLIYSGFETEEQDFINSTLKSGDIFVDIGANVGLFTLSAAKIVGNTGKVISFEPTPVTYERLGLNIAENSFMNVDSRNKGLGHEIANLNLNISDNGFDAWNSFVITDSQKLKDSVTVEVSTLDLELAEIDKSRITVVKIDVEGWEKFVLEGGKSFFINYSPIVLVEFTETNTLSAGYHVHEIFDLMVDYGYQWYRINNGELVIEKKRENYPYDNLIAIKLKSS